MEYNEVIVENKRLKRNVLCFWQMTGFIDQDFGLSFRHIPKGQSLLIFNYGDDIERLDTKKVKHFKSSIFVLPAIASSSMFKQKGKIDLFGISLIADGLFNILQQPISGLKNESRINLDNKYKELYTILKELNFDEKSKLAESFLERNIIHKSYSQPFTRAFKLINETKGNIKVSDIVDKVHVSERQLQRLFSTRLGISPKDYCKVVRFNSYIEFILTKENDVDWMELVVAFNYHDQPHLINEIKSITKLSPKKLLSYRDTLYDRYSY